MHPDPHALKIYVDGSAFKNPGGPGGLAGIAEFPEHMNRPNEVLFEEGYKSTTNNRMELRACIRALEYTRRSVPSGISRVIVITDSLYLHQCLSSAPYWKKQKWLSLDGKPIENPDLWDEIITLRPKLRVVHEIQWSKGKTSPILKEVDRRAKAAAARCPIETDWGFRGGKVGRSKAKSKRASTLFPAQGQEAVINIYRKRLPGRTEDKIYFDLFAEEQKEFSAKYHAFSTAEIAMDLHRGNCYRVRFNNDPKHPVIEAILGHVDI